MWKGSVGVKKTKGMLLKEFNKLQKDYLKAVRENRLEEAQEIVDIRRRVQLQLREVDESYEKRR